MPPVTTDPAVYPTVLNVHERTWTALGATGVFIAITVAESLIAVVGVLAFRRGGWKKQQI